MVTVFKNSYELLDAHYISVKSALERIKNGKSKEQVEQIRRLIAENADEKLISKQKAKLVSVLFHGRFDKEIEIEKDGKKYKSKRNDECISTHSGFIVLDFDKCDVQTKMAQLRADYFIYAAWVSPSGKGVKALVKIPATIEGHQNYYNSILDRYPDADPTSRSLSRLCYESYDPNIYINENSSVWDRSITEQQKKEVERKKEQRREYKVLATAVTMIRSSYDGVKHDTLLKASKYLGGYVSVGRITYDEAKRVLLEEISYKQPKDIKGAEKTIEDGLKYGMAQPFLEAKKIERQQDLPKDEEGNYTFIANDKEMGEYEEALLNGTLEMGLTTGYEPLDKHWVFKKHTVVWIAAADNVGKSNWVWYNAVMAAALHGWKILIHSAENLDGQVKKKIKEFYIGIPFLEMNPAQREVAETFFQEHFRIMTSNQLHTWDDLLLKAEVYYEECFKFNLLIAEPYNAMDLPDGMDSHRHNLKALNAIRVFKSNVSALWVCDHIGTPAARNREQDGSMKTPHKSDVDGGQLKANKVDDFIILHRDTKGDNWMYLQINIDKIKDTETGGMPTYRAEPIMLRMNPNKCGYTLNGVDAIQQYWTRKTGVVIRQDSAGSFFDYQGDAPF